MPYRLTPLVTNEIYHIYNRGVEKRTIFSLEKEYEHFLQTLMFYKFKEASFRFSLTPRVLHLGGGAKVRPRLYRLLRTA